LVRKFSPVEESSLVHAVGLSPISSKGVAAVARTGWVRFPTDNLLRTTITKKHNVDLHSSSLAAFKRWMQVNHVRVDGHLLSKLTQRFTPRVAEVKSAYGGLWNYLM
jgi:hypothetical protein